MTSCPCRVVRGLARLVVDLVAPPVASSQLSTQVKAVSPMVGAKAAIIGANGLRAAMLAIALAGVGVDVAFAPRVG